MHRHLRIVVVAGLAVALAGACRQGDSPQALAKLDSLSRAGAQRDSLVAEMAYDARVLSDIGTTLARVSIPKGKIRVSAESPMQAWRDSMVQRVRYVAARLPEAERLLRRSEERVAGLTSLSDSLRTTLEATLANYREIVDSQRAQIGMLVAVVDTLRGQVVALGCVNETERVIGTAIAFRAEVRVGDSKRPVEHAQDIKFPLIVKPASEDASKGIDAKSVVDSIKDLMERIEYIHDEFGTAALIEEYIDGREIYAAVLGDDKPEALPLIELDLSKLPEGEPRIAGYEVKFDVNTEAYKVTKSAPAQGLDEELVEQIHNIALETWRALKFRDYGRIDCRVTKDGRVGRP